MPDFNRMEEEPEAFGEICLACGQPLAGCMVVHGLHRECFEAELDAAFPDNNLGDEYGPHEVGADRRVSLDDLAARL